MKKVGKVNRQSDKDRKEDRQIGTDEQSAGQTDSFTNSNTNGKR